MNFNVERKPIDDRLSLETVVDRGKHAGKAVAWVIRNAPDYVQFMIENKYWRLNDEAQDLQDIEFDGYLENQRRNLIDDAADDLHFTYLF